MDFGDAYYLVVRKLSYTWNELLGEKVPRILFMLEKLEDEGQRKKEQLDDIPDNPEQAAKSENPKTYT